MISSLQHRCNRQGNYALAYNTAQKMKFSIKDFFSKCDQIRRKRTCLSFIVHVACSVNKKFGSIIKSVNLFPDHKRWKYICMKYLNITKYIHCFSMNKCTNSFTITKLTTEHWSWPQSTLDTNLGVIFSSILNRTLADLKYPIIKA